MPRTPASAAYGWTRIAATAALLTGGLLVSGCQRIMNGPRVDPAAQRRPDQILEFDDLYNRNCAACHGADGKNGTSIPMNNPVYMAIASDARIRSVTVNGEPGSLMPAFGRSAGGLLTDQQIDAIVAGMRRRWGQPVAGLNPPPYAATGPGDPSRGAQVYRQGCAGCHGALPSEAEQAKDQAQPNSNSSLVREKPGKAGSIVDPTFLALLSDQGLRTIIIAGRPDIGQPDWRGDIPGHPLTDTEITDLVAWLAARRLPVPAQPHADPAGPHPAASALQRRTE